MTVDLRTQYLGLELAHPVVASAGPLTGRLDTLEQLVEAGAAAVVLPSLFEEEILQAGLDLQAVLTQGTESFPEAITYLPDLDGDAVGPERTLRLVRDAKRAVDVPVIASLNGTTSGGWARYASELVDAGADALELNVYFVAADPADEGDAVEARYLDLLSTVRERVDVPVALKLSPFFTALAHTAARFADAGADGLVLFNRFMQPDIDLDSLEVHPSIELSTSADLRLPLRWVALLRGPLTCSLALSGGVHTPADAVKALLAGADVVMTTSGTLRHGPGHLTELRDGLTRWLDERGYASAAQARGSVSGRTVPDPDRYERASYVAALRAYSSRHRSAPSAVE